MTVRLHIDRLVVDAGLGVTGVEGEVLRDAIQAELSRLLAEAGPGWASSEEWRVQGPEFERPAGAGADAFGTTIAGALHGCLRQEKGERVP